MKRFRVTEYYNTINTLHVTNYIHVSIWMMVFFCFVACMTIDEEINGRRFIKLPCDKQVLKQDYELTTGGADEIATLLSEVQPHTPGPDHKEEKGEWMGRGPYKLIATC